MKVTVSGVLKVSLIVVAFIVFCFYMGTHEPQPTDPAATQKQAVAQTPAPVHTASQPKTTEEYRLQGENQVAKATADLQQPDAKWGTSGAQGYQDHTVQNDLSLLLVGQSNEQIALLKQQNDLLTKQNELLQQLVAKQK